MYLHHHIIHNAACNNCMFEQTKIRLLQTELFFTVLVLLDECFVLTTANTRHTAVLFPLCMLRITSISLVLFHFNMDSVMCLNSCSTVCCPIAGCGAHLDCLEDFEDHYSTRHTASCPVCSRVYPTSRLLIIHISEAHDSFFQAKVARGFPMVITSIPHHLYELFTT